jgi:hypothetical protein
VLTWWEINHSIDLLQSYGGPSKPENCLNGAVYCWKAYHECSKDLPRTMAKVQGSLTEPVQLSDRNLRVFIAIGAVYSQCPRTWSKISDHALLDLIDEELAKVDEFAEIRMQAEQPTQTQVEPPRSTRQPALISSRIVGCIAAIAGALLEELEPPPSSRPC